MPDPQDHDQNGPGAGKKRKPFSPPRLEEVEPTSERARRLLEKLRDNQS